MCEYGCETLWDSLCYSYNILFSLHTDESEMERLFVHVTGITWQLYEYYYMNGYMHMLVYLSVYFLPGCWMYMCKMRIFFISKHSHSYLRSNVLGRVCVREIWIKLTTPLTFAFSCLSCCSTLDFSSVHGMSCIWVTAEIRRMVVLFLYCWFLSRRVVVS